MTVQHAIPELWSARLLQGFDQDYIWRGLVTDLSSEFSDGGDQLHLNEVTTDVAIGDYTKDTDIGNPQIIDDSDVVLTLDKQKFYNIAVDDVDRAQTRPNLLNEFSRKAGVALSGQVDADISAAVLAGIPAGQKDNAADAFPGANPNKAAREAFIERILQRKDAMDAADVPEAGRWVVFNRAVYGQLVRYLVFDRNVGTGALEDAAWQQAALSNLFGLTVRKDNSLPAAAAAGVVQAIMGIPQATAFARQVEKTEPYRMEKRFSDAVKGLMVYGSKVIDPDGLYQIEQKA